MHTVCGVLHNTVLHLAAQHTFEAAYADHFALRLTQSATSTLGGYVLRQTEDCRNMALVGVAGTQQRRRASAQPGFGKGLREVLYERAELQPPADRPERESACEAGRQANAWAPATGAAACCEPRVEVRIAAPGAAAGGKVGLPCEYEPGARLRSPASPLLLSKPVGLSEQGAVLGKLVTSRFLLHSAPLTCTVWLSKLFCKALSLLTVGQCPRVTRESPCCTYAAVAATRLWAAMPWTAAGAQRLALLCEPQWKVRVLLKPQVHCAYINYAARRSGYLLSAIYWKYPVYHLTPTGLHRT